MGGCIGYSPTFEIPHDGFTCNTSSADFMQLYVSKLREDQYKTEPARGTLVNGELLNCSQTKLFDANAFSTGWITKGNGVGEWITIFLNEEYLVSKIVYTHFDRRWAYGRFKDISFEFSDGTYVNTTLDNTELDIHLNVDPPKMTSLITLAVQTTYNNSNTCTFWTLWTKFKGPCTVYGIKDLRIFGSVLEGK